MTGEEKARAKTVGATSFFRGKRFQSLKEEHIFGALDAGVGAMVGLGFPEPYNGRVLAALALVLVKNDAKSVGDLHQRKIDAIVKGSEEERREFFELLSLEISERYLAARKGKIPTETQITSPDSLLEKLEGVFEEMEEMGKAMASVSVLSDEMSLTIENDMPDTMNIARALVEGVIGSYESLVPPVDADGELPNPVQRRAIAKAAFLRLGVDDLVQLAAEKEIGDLPSKAALAKALAETYQDDLDEVARLTLREADGDPQFGLITRLLPLPQPPSLPAAKHGFEALRGHYFEVRPAVFFVYRDVSESQDGKFLTITGALRSFQVSPVEVAGQIELNSRPRKDDVEIKLQEGQPWAVVSARRASDLGAIGAVLRRSGEVATSGAVPAPDPLGIAPYGTWDSRSLWMLDFFRRDLQADTLKLEETLMANFDSSRSSDLTDEEGDEGKPRLASVRLKGRQLQDHPEVCSRIVGRAHLKEVEFRLRKVTDVAKGFSTLTRVLLAWERDHLAVMTGDSGETFDLELHQRLIRLIRDAAARPLSAELIPILERVQARSEETDVEADADRVLTGPTSTPPEPEEGEIVVSAGD